LFWFSDGQWARIEPFIPSNRRGVKPKNNRRILSGVMHVLKSGCRWVDCPPEHGPAKTVYNRFNRWSAQGIWQSIFEAAAEPAEPPERMALDSTHVKAHRGAGGGKGGVGTGDWRHQGGHTPDPMPAFLSGPGPDPTPTPAC
jgi:transposase